MMVMSSFYSVNGYVVILLIHFISTFTFGDGKDIICDEGQHVTLEVPVNFTVDEKMVMFGCLDGSRSEERKSYPGSPESLTYNSSLNNKSFTLTWKPPDDSSTEHVTGFLLEMFIEDTGDTMSFGPSACFKIDSRLAAENSVGKVTQDAVFQLNCKMKEALNVSISVMSLPVPAERRKYKVASVYVNFKDTTTITLPNPKTTLINNEDPEVEDRTGSIIAFSLGVVIVSFVSVSFTICIVCKRRYRDHRLTSSINGTKQNDDSTIKESFRQVLNSPNTTLSAKNDGTGKFNKDEITEYSRTVMIDNRIQNCTTETCDSEGYHDLRKETSNSLTVTETDINSVPIPQKYRLQLQIINLDS